MASPFVALRNLQDFRAHALAFFDKAGVYESGVAEIDFGVRRAFAIGDPALATAILTSPAFDKGSEAYGPFGTFAGFGSLRGLVGCSLPVLDGDAGAQRRRVLTPVYSGIVGRFAERSAASRLTFPPVDDPRCDIYPLLSRVVFDRFCAVMFGRVYPEMATPVSLAVTTSTTALDALSKSFLPYAGRLGPDARTLRRCRAVLLEFSRRVYADLRANDSDAAFAPMLDSGLNETEVVDEILTQVVAGTETTTITACWAMSLLARHPGYTERIRSRSEPELVELCVKETLRLYPAFWSVIRVANQPVTLEGRAFPTGAVTFVSPYCVHHNPAAWPSPDDFRPDRFVGREGIKGDFMPFGYGARACIGARLATAIVNECVEEAVHQLDFALPDDEPAGHAIDPLIVVLKSQTGFHFRVRHRGPPPLRTPDSAPGSTSQAPAAAPPTGG